MTTEDIFKTMQDLIAEQFAIDADEITMDSSFVDDLGADSVDLVELVMAMEEEFDIGEIEEEDLTGLKTVGDCVKYLTNKIGPLPPQTAVQLPRPVHRQLDSGRARPLVTLCACVHPFRQRFLLKMRES